MTNMKEITNNIIHYLEDHDNLLKRETYVVYTPSGVKPPDGFTSILFCESHNCILKLQYSPISQRAINWFKLHVAADVEYVRTLGNEPALIVPARAEEVFLRTVWNAALNPTSLLSGGQLIHQAANGYIGDDAYLDLIKFQMAYGENESRVVFAAVRHEFIGFYRWYHDLMFDLVPISETEAMIRVSSDSDGVIAVLPIYEVINLLPEEYEEVKNEHGGIYNN